ncbi:hypothetical protein [Microbacterium sp.]|uniref:hypothetical protein n=1 Tax=Microbacterium sp. TaxID=51671 RepID=UPI0028120B1F|nr:hypothetical protein [Microbacterium sp.]
MTITTFSARTGSALTAGMLALGVLAGCTPAPQPEPTETALFASEEEAFAAAEETYRAYTDAVNGTDLSDPRSIEPVYALLTDPAEAASRENYSLYKAESVTRTGTTTFDTFTPVSYEGELVITRVCLDVSEVDLLNADGVSIVSPDREARQPIELEMVPGDSPTGLVIRSNTIAEDFQC